MPKGRAKQPKSVETLTHEEARRRNLPSAEHQPLMRDEEQSPIRLIYERRNRDLDPQLVWRGKDQQDWSDLVVNAPPLYIQERVHPKVLIDDLARQSRDGPGTDEYQTDMFADFNGLPSDEARTEFYQHDANWSNRMVLGDNLHVMASLAEREGLRGKVQCIYIYPPYGIKFNSNFQWSTTSRDVKDGNASHITREPEQVKAFRDTWRDGIHSYLTYLRDRIMVARDLLSNSGSIFVQIGEGNVHRVRALLDEIFGEENFITQITYKTNSPLGEEFLASNSDYILWYARSRDEAKWRPLYLSKGVGEGTLFNYVELPGLRRRSATREERQDPQSVPPGARFFYYNVLISSGYTPSCTYDFTFEGRSVKARAKSWRTTHEGMKRLDRANRLIMPGSLPYMVSYHEDFAVKVLTSTWDDSRSAMNKIFVVQTATSIVERCVLMTTDPGDLVLDPTCGSGTTAYVAEQWGRRWITVDTSRVALALARARMMGARHPYYLLSDSREGQLKEAEVERRASSESPTHGDIRQGFVYERVPHITLRAIANNAEIDVIWEDAQEELEPLREELNRVLGVSWQEWEIPRDADETWPDEVRSLHSQWWDRRIARQKEIDASIAGNADYEYLYDKPYEVSRAERNQAVWRSKSVPLERRCSAKMSAYDGCRREPLVAARSVESRRQGNRWLSAW